MKRVTGLGELMDAQTAQRARATRAFDAPQWAVDLRAQLAHLNSQVPPGCCLRRRTWKCVPGT